LVIINIFKFFFRTGRICQVSFDAEAGVRNAEVNLNTFLNWDISVKNVELSLNDFLLIYGIKGSG
jgi:hypothetical protein